MFFIEHKNKRFHFQYSTYTTIMCLYVTGVTPDIEFGQLFLPVFGEKSHVIRKFRRTYYWMHKFAKKNPYRLPHDLPTDPIKLALLALKKMSVDLENELDVWTVCKQYRKKQKKKPYIKSSFEQTLFSP